MRLKDELLKLDGVKKVDVESEELGVIEIIVDGGEHKEIIKTIYQEVEACYRTVGDIEEVYEYSISRGDGSSRVFKSIIKYSRPKDNK